MIPDIPSELADCFRQVLEHKFNTIECEITSPNERGQVTVYVKRRLGSSNIGIGYMRLFKDMGALVCSAYDAWANDFKGRRERTIDACRILGNYSLPIALIEKMEEELKALDNGIPQIVITQQMVDDHLKAEWERGKSKPLTEDELRAWEV